MALDGVAVFGANDNAVGSIFVVFIPGLLDEIFEIDGGRLTDRRVREVCYELEDNEGISRNSLSLLQLLLSLRKRDAPAGKREKGWRPHGCSETLSIHS